MHSRNPKTERWNACSRNENLFKRPPSRAEAIAEITYLTSRQPTTSCDTRFTWGCARTSWTTRYSASARNARAKSLGQ